MLTLSDRQTACRTAVAAASDAWQLVAPYHRGKFTIFQKPDGPATEADREADAAISAALQSQFPASDFGYLTEESENDAARLKCDSVWIIDPIDGTNDFIEGLDDFAVHIALAERNTSGGFIPTVAVVYLPRHGRWHWAMADQGAWESKDEDAARKLEGQRLHVSPAPALEQSRAVVSRSHMTRRLKAALEALPLAGHYRRGSVGVKLMEIASGRAELYMNPMFGKASEWDLCAPSLIVEEAGGRVTDFEGAAYPYNQSCPILSRGILASNGRIHSDLVTRLGGTFAALK